MGLLGVDGDVGQPVPAPSFVVRQGLTMSPCWPGT